MARSTVHYADNKTNNILKALHNKLRPAGTPVQRVEYIIELLLLRIFEVKVKRDDEFEPLRKLFKESGDNLLFSDLFSLNGNQALAALNQKVFPFYGDILRKARDVFKNKNLPQKVQDQLVLIEEVFSNSNFSSNVKNGNLNEILGLVSDIDEERLLKTDLLGDAIESALSEQGGTKDVGLHRTPDHIRQMMVAMADPDFSDTVFDPACGTGGFLFDAFQYVLEKIKKDGDWPGDKAHKELKKYLSEYIENYDAEMPSGDTSNTFYRVGIAGVEYLGMIRKMAAINLYIRGLNPANIEQGDSLDLFDPGTDAETKSVVIANPPFGAKLDQPAYPKVWEEYPKTDSTTLFVKLMFNYLKPGGRCAVVVSEGFLTWDNEPAKEMRKMLLEEANLKAIISLPQGVFVSKNGQGAKTSILYFEKGQPTKNVWFYKITNDGYSMGVNRKEIAGSQIPEVLKLFNKYVKQGKIPPKTKNSFSIPAEWIKQIDPRLKQRIAIEAEKQQKEKFAAKKKKEIEKLDGQLAKGKITKKEYEEKIWQFDDILKSGIQNEIAKRIEKAHSYSFNLQNYRSNLSDDQIKKWQGAFEGVEVKNGTDIDSRYQELLKADSETALSILASFDPESALEMDIAREYLSKLKVKSEKLKELEEILKEAQKFSKVLLGSLLCPKNNKIKIESGKSYREITLKLYGKGIAERRTVKGEEISFDECYLLEKYDIVTSIHQFRNGCFVKIPKNFEGYIVSKNFLVYEIDKNVVNPSYLQYVVTSDTQIKKYQSGSQGGATPIYPREDILKVEIPLPPIEKQREIVEKIERQKAIIEGVEKILDVCGVDMFIDLEFDHIEINSLAVVNGSPIKNLSGFKEEIYVGGENIESGTGILKNLKTVQEAGVKGPSYVFKKGNVVYSKVRPNLRKCFYATFNGVCSSDIYPLKVNLEIIDPKYLTMILQSNYFSGQTQEFQKGRSGMPKINQDQLAQIKIPLPSLEIQKQIVVQLDKEMETLEKVRGLKKQAEERINKILEGVWGE